MLGILSTEWQRRDHGIVHSSNAFRWRGRLIEHPRGTEARARVPGSLHPSQVASNKILSNLQNCFDEGFAFVSTWKYLVYCILNVRYSSSQSSNILIDKQSNNALWSMDGSTSTFKFQSTVSKIFITLRKYQCLEEILPRRKRSFNIIYIQIFRSIWVYTYTKFYGTCVGLL